jgi:hypothetical protein
MCSYSFYALFPLLTTAAPSPGPTVSAMLNPNQQPGLLAAGEPFLPGSQEFDPAD